MNQPIFPNSTTKLYLQGPAGRLELAVEFPKISALPYVGIACHPHPLYGGTMDNKVVTTTTRAYNHLGIPCIRFNFRGVGGSEGSYGDVEGELEDLEAVINWVNQHNPDAEFHLTGFSFGSYIAACAARPAKAKGLISIAPPVHHFDFHKLPKPKCPWLIIQGDNDEIVPAKEVYNWIERLDPPPTLIVVSGAGHFFHGRLIELREIIQDAIVKQLQI